MKVFLILVSLIVLSGIIYAHENYGSPDPYENGYFRGYRHGSEDQRAGVNFDYRHNYEHQDSEQEHMSYDPEESCDLRLGYVEGYVDGYFGHQSRVHRHEGDIGHGMEPIVIVFTGKGYTEDSKEFKIGHYSSLEGDFHDNIDSLHIYGHVRVILFDDSNFKGKHIVLKHETPDLDDFNNKAASMIIEPIE